MFVFLHGNRRHEVIGETSPKRSLSVPQRCLTTSCVACAKISLRLPIAHHDVTIRARRHLPSCWTFRDIHSLHLMGIDGLCWVTSFAIPSRTKINICKSTLWLTTAGSIRWSRQGGLPEYSGIITHHRIPSPSRWRKNLPPREDEGWGHPLCTHSTWFFARELSFHQENLAISTHQSPCSINGCGLFDTTNHAMCFAHAIRSIALLQRAQCRKCGIFSSYLCIKLTVHLTGQLQLLPFCVMNKKQITIVSAFAFRYHCLHTSILWLQCFVTNK